MRIVIATVQVPFVTGGAEILVNMLKDELVKRNHKVEVLTIPFLWGDYQGLINAMIAGRMIDVRNLGDENIDLVIGMKFPAYYLKHDNKVMWLMHQHRQAYDLWDTDFSNIQHWENADVVRDLIRQSDNKYISESKNVFTIAKTTSNRLKKYNNIDSEVLYHPPLHYDQFHCDDYGDYVFYPSRISLIKRQYLLVEAAQYLKTDAKIMIAGSGSQVDIDHLEEIIETKSLQDKVKLLGFISDEEKIRLYSNCLAVYFGPYDEDYGYVTLESFYSNKAVITHTDSGGPLEFVEDGKNGFVIEPDPQKIAERIDQLYLDKQLAKSMGELGRATLDNMNINWDYVIDRLLGE